MLYNRKIRILHPNTVFIHVLAYRLIRELQERFSYNEEKEDPAWPSAGGWRRSEPPETVLVLGTVLRRVPWTFPRSTSDHPQALAAGSLATERHNSKTQCTMVRTLTPLLLIAVPLVLLEMEFTAVLAAAAAAAVVVAGGVGGRERRRGVGMGSGREGGGNRAGAAGPSHPSPTRVRLDWKLWKCFWRGREVGTGVFCLLRRGCSGLSR